ncbi:MAG: glucosylceramidase [Chitinophagaceae bacterium BSSC1]|nr:MAG: glucosylceramidase [Chitinophagaceae bacterium BSSC1]
MQIKTFLFCLFFSLGAMAQKGTPVSYWLTTADQSALLQEGKANWQTGAVNQSMPIISIDEQQHFQTIDGFGYTLTGGSAQLLYQLPKDQRQTLLQELFSSKGNGIGISYLRISVGASDLDATVFTYDDPPKGETDFALKHFSLGPNLKNLIPVLQEIIAIQPKIKILATPWTAPVWMKTNANSIGGKLKPACYQVYAQYLVKYIQAMKAKGILVDAITPQNEPLNPKNNPSLDMQAEEQAIFIADHLGPAFQKAAIKTKIVLYDHNCDRPDYPISILNNVKAKPFINGSAFHLYGGDIKALSAVHDAHPDKALYFTEQWVGGPSNFAGDFGWHLKNVVIGSMRNWSKNALEWNLAADAEYQPHTPGGCTNCLGALTIQQNAVARNVAYYIIGQASKFVPVGSVRIASNLPTDLPNVAFKRPDGKKVLLVFNDGKQEQSFGISSNGKMVSTKLPAGAAATYVW